MKTPNDTESPTAPNTSSDELDCPALAGSHIRVGCKIVRGGHMVDVINVTPDSVRYEKTMEMSFGLYETETIEEDFETFSEQVSFTLAHGAKFIPANKVVGGSATN